MNNKDYAEYNDNIINPTNNNFNKIRGYSDQKQNADFNSVLSKNKYPKMMSSYSLKDKLNKLTQLEGFSNIDNNYIYYIILIIIILIFILIKYIKNKKIY